MLEQYRPMIDGLTTIRDELPDGAAKTQINNVLVVTNAAPQLLRRELSRVDALLAQAPGEAA